MPGCVCTVYDCGSCGKACLRMKDITDKFIPSPPPGFRGSARLSLKKGTVEATARNKHLEGERLLRRRTLQRQHCRPSLVRQDYFRPVGSGTQQIIATCPTGRSSTSFPVAVQRSRRAPACR